MKKFIVFFTVLGVMGSNSVFLKEITTDANLPTKNIHLENAVKSPLKYSTNIIWFIN